MIWRRGNRLFMVEMNEVAEILENATKKELDYPRRNRQRYIDI